MHEGTDSTDPKLQALHDTGRQQHIREESQGGSSVDNAAEARGLQSDQTITTKNTARKKCGQRVTHYSFQNKVSFFLSVEEEIARVEGGYKGLGQTSGTGVYDVKFRKKSVKKFLKKIVHRNASHIPVMSYQSSMRGEVYES